MPRVLVVDDDPEVRRLITLLLGSKGFAVVGAADGEEGLRKMREQRPCVVVLDIQMPTVDGWRFRERQLQEPDLADVPVICITGMFHPEDVGRKLGIPCLGKPLDFPLLVSAVQTACAEPVP